MKTTLRYARFVGMVALALPTLAAEPTAAERVAAIKANLAASQKALRQYEWIETVVVSVKSEEKSRQMNRCYYGADGAEQKVPLTTPPPEEKRRGLRGRIIEHKKEEMADYMKSAIHLAKSYVPPNPAKIQAVKDAGGVSIDVLDPGKRVRVNFKDYHKNGDVLGVEADLTNDRVLALTVNSYLDDPEDAVSLKAQFAALADGTSYPKTITLDAPHKDLQVRLDNSGYRKTP